MSEETLLARLRTSLSPTSQPIDRLQPDPLDEAKVRASVSQAARSRVSATLRQLRAARSLSYDAIRERTGLSQQLLYDIEYGDRRLTLDELILLAECYGVSADDVLGIDLGVAHESVDSGYRRLPG